MVKKIGSILFFCSALIGCAVGRPYGALVEKLENRGFVQLNQENRFVASNLFLSKEADRSPDLKGFLGIRGQPSALKLETSLFSAMEIELIYPELGERYALQEDGTSWIIDGPFPLESATSQKPVFETARARASTSTPSDLENSPFISPAIKQETSPDPLTNARSKYGKNAVEQSPKGDIVHFVTRKEETLELLAAWYTNSVENAPIIGRINQLPTVEIGSQVVIPSYLANYRFRLSDAAITELAPLFARPAGI